MPKRKEATRLKRDALCSEIAALVHQRYPCSKFGAEWIGPYSALHREKKCPRNCSVCADRLRRVEEGVFAFDPDIKCLRFYATLPQHFVIFLRGTWLCSACCFYVNMNLGATHRALIGLELEPLFNGIVGLALMVLNYVN